MNFLSIVSGVLMSAQAAYRIHEANERAAKIVEL